MKRLQVFMILLLVSISVNSCKSIKKEGNLYITDQTHSGADIFTVKILKHSCNQSSEKNIFSDYKEIITYGGYTWYVYDIPEGTWDIYIEYYEDYKFRNEREYVYINGDSSGNEWAAIWLVSNYDNSVRTEQGIGEINITSSLFY